MQNGKRLIVTYHPRSRIELDRLDLMAAYAGVPRAEFVRQAVAFTDSALVLDALQRTAEGQEHVAEVLDNMEAVLARLRPRPVPPPRPVARKTNVSTSRPAPEPTT